MKHTYIFDTEKWWAAGTYYDESGIPYAIGSATDICHDQNQWTLAGTMDVAFDKPVRFTNAYAIAATDDPTTLASTATPTPALWRS